MAAFFAALVALKQWAAVIAAALGFARQVADTVQTEQDMRAGRAEAEADGLKLQQQQLGEADAAVDAARASQAAHPGSDDGLDTQFRRD